ncbi:MAG: hypothetical protein IJL74_01210 [Bacilli bacterium]|nr:hypothetical protein [Bacilli bacterium]
MKLEDYINSMKIPSKRKMPEIKFTACNIDNYDNISEDKKELIKEVFFYLSEDLFMDVFERRERQISEYAYYQSRSNEGERVLVRIRICDFPKNSNMLQPISRDRFDAEYNRCAKVGAQKYANVNFLIYRDADDSGCDRYMEIYYMDDGSVFLDSSTANIIKKINVNDLGKYLARVCIEWMEEEKEHGYSRVRK